MWAGQPRPLPTGEMHVIVATIQTLSAKIARQPEYYEFLADFKLLVFDVAHRSVAPHFHISHGGAWTDALEKGRRTDSDRPYRNPIQRTRRSGDRAAREPLF